jgi:dienelactone hydrolase
MAAGVRGDHTSCSTSDVETLQTFDFNAWLVNHGAEVTRPPLDKVIAALKEQGVSTFGASGYCFGALYSMDLAFENVTKAIVISHPSFLQLPEDLEVCGLPVVTAELGLVERCSDTEGMVQ